jgi:hypothetical protein
MVNVALIETKKLRGMPQPNALGHGTSLERDDRLFTHGDGRDR